MVNGAAKYYISRIMILEFSIYKFIIENMVRNLIKHEKTRFYEKWRTALVESVKGVNLGVWQEAYSMFFPLLDGGVFHDGA